MDLLSDLLRTIRLTGSVFFLARFSDPWSVRAESAERLARELLPTARRLVLFHYVAGGECWAEIRGQRRLLNAGDLLILPHGDAHVMGRGHAARAQDVATLFPSPPPWSEPPRIVAGGGGAETSIVCGFLHYDDGLYNPLVEALPSEVVIATRTGSGASLLAPTLALLERQLHSNAAGTESVVGRLTELLFVEALRVHVNGLPTGELGWLAALRDEGVRRALEAIHERPEHAWSVEALARRAGMSRSSFHERFGELLGASPARYLTRWRLQRAAHRLLDGDETLAEVASRCGYASEAAFNRAFKRHMGEAPARWRRSRKAERPRASR